jgi:predicted PurR-regulated permease PerM
VEIEARTEPHLLPLGARRTAAWCGVLLLTAGVVAVGIWLCMQLQAVVTPVLLAVLGTALLRPVHDRLVRLRVPRSLAAGLTCAVLVAVVGGAGYIVVSALIDTGDQIIASVRQAAQDLSKNVGFAGASLDELAAKAKELAGGAAGSAATGVLSGIGLVTQLLAAAVLALLLTFFFLRDADRATGVLHEAAPRGTGRQLEAIARRGFGAVEGFMRGTTLIALIDAVCITVGLLILGVPGAIGLGALVFVGAYIPYLGALISGAVAVLVALADRGFAIALWVLMVVLLVQLLEGNVLQPMIQSRTVHMHPALVLIALTAGASLAGIVGMLLAVPIAAALFGAVSEIRGGYSTDDRAASSGSSVPPASPSEASGPPS